MKTIYSPRIVALSFWFLIPALFCYFEYNYLKEYLSSFQSGIFIIFIAVGLIGFLLTLLRGIFPIEEENERK